MELDLHADDYAKLEKAAQNVGLSVEEYLRVVASRWLAEAPMPGKPAVAMRRKLELVLHPDDYSQVERAAQAVGYTVEEYGRLSLHLQSRGMLDRSAKPSPIERPLGVVQQAASWLTSLSPTIGDRRSVGVPHE
ncbi:hypothetical protein ACTMU2_14000 [Cupriavidus basilensis]